MVRTRRISRLEEPQVNDNRAPQDPLQLILERLEQQQKTIEDMRANQARQEQERDATIAAAVATAIANLNAGRPEEGRPVVPPPTSEPLQPARAVVPVPDPDTIQQWMVRFCKYNPPSFDGIFDVQVAEDWINRLEKIFKVLDCPTERKAQMAIYKLEKDADRWWRNTELILEARHIRVTWEVFLEHFYEKYFPRSVRDEREAEFLTLKQQNHESFDDYLAKFIRLSHYSSYLRYRDDERWTTEKMVRGLKQPLREMIAPRQFEEFNRAVEACRITESSMNHVATPTPVPRIEKAPEQTDQSGAPSGNSKKRKRPWNNKKGKKGAKPGNQSKGKECEKCGKNHGDRPCLAGQNVCYTCGKPGHFSKECPQNAEKPRPRTHGRVFAFTQEEARKSPEMIEGTISINNCLVIAMFDTGASHSFISYNCAKRLGLVISMLPYDICVSTPTRSRVVTSDVCLNCLIQYEHCCTTLDLICMPFHEIDVIIGLNWLSSQNIMLDCKNRTLVVPPKEIVLGPEVELNFITEAQADKCLRSGCQGFFVFFSMQAEVEEGVKELPIVKEFPEVFPKEFSGLPPEREVEFAIDIVPGAGPISKAPYRMAPNEMAELKK